MQKFSAKDYDLQDIITVNLSRAVQLCVDIGAHILADLRVRSPDTMGQTFDLLAESDIITDELASRLRKAVGFRNVAVHNYDEMDWNMVYAQHHLDDFKEFARAVIVQMAASVARME